MSVTTRPLRAVRIALLWALAGCTPDTATPPRPAASLTSVESIATPSPSLTAPSERTWTEVARFGDHVAVAGAFSPEGVTLLFDDSQVCHHDLPSFAEQWCLPVSNVQRMIGSADGSRIALEQYYGYTEITVVDGQEGSLVSTLEDAGKGIALSPDGTRFAATADGTTLVIGETATGAALHHLPLETPPANSGTDEDAYGLAWSRDGSRIAAGGDGGLFIIDAAAGVVLHSVTEGIGGIAQPPVWSGNSARVFWMDRTPEAVSLKSWSAAGVVEHHRFEPDRWPIDLITSPDGQRLALPMPDGHIELFDVNSGAVSTLAQLDAPAGTLGWSPDGRELWALPNTIFSSPGTGQHRRTVGRIVAVGVPEGAVRDLAGLQIGHADAVQAVAWSGDSLHFASVARNSPLIVWGLNGDPVQTFSRSETSLDVEWQGQRLAEGGFQGVFVWDGQGLVFELDYGSAFTLSPDGQQIAILGPGGVEAVIEIHDIESAQKTAEIRIPDAEPGRGSRLVWAEYGMALIDVIGMLYVVDSSTQAVRLELPLDAPLNSVFSPDGLQVAVLKEGEIEIRRLPSGDVVQTLPVGGVYVAAFSADREWLAVSIGDSIEFWNIQTGRLEMTIPTSASWTVTALSFSPDNAYLAAGYSNGSLSLLRSESHP